MGLQRITAPTLAVVTVAEMKAHLRITWSEEDAYLQTLIEEAAAHLDGWQGLLGWCIGSQQWLLTYDTFPDGPIRLPLGPLISVDAVRYDDGSPALVTLSADAYAVDGTDKEAWLMPVDSWPSVDGTNAVEVRFTAGHATAAEVHAGVKTAIRLIVASWYANREGQAIPLSADALISPLRKVKL